MKKFFLLVVLAFQTIIHILNIAKQQRMMIESLLILKEIQHIRKFWNILTFHKVWNS